ncbi:MAG: plastocyanin/azurin family copper-binding protein [Thermomicrobiales bacterium]
MTASIVPLVQGCGNSDDDSGGTTDIEMNDGLAFDPEMLTIDLGQTVTWRNVGTMVHTATNDIEQAQNPDHAVLPEGAVGWDSGLIRAGESWSHTFDLTGEYTYFCIPHEAAGMVGKVVVT